MIQLFLIVYLQMNLSPRMRTDQLSKKSYNQHQTLFRKTWHKRRI